MESVSAALNDTVTQQNRRSVKRTNSRFSSRVVDIDVISILLSLDIWQMGIHEQR